MNREQALARAFLNVVQTQDGMGFVRQVACQFDRKFWAGQAMARLCAIIWAAN